MATSKAEMLITSTIETLDNGIDSAKPKDGASLIEEWLALVKRDELDSSIAAELQKLHDQLAEEEPDKRKVIQLVKKLGSDTAKAARKADGAYQHSLKDLSESLKEFADELK